MASANKVQISIRGRRYTMRTDEADVDLAAIGRYVERRMDEIAEKAGNPDEYTVALLAALNIASEYERFRRDVDVELAEIDRELASTVVMIEAALPGAVGADAEEAE